MPTIRSVMYLVVGIWLRTGLARRKTHSQLYPKTRCFTASEPGAMPDKGAPGRATPRESCSLQYTRHTPQGDGAHNCGRTCGVFSCFMVGTCTWPLLNERSFVLLLTKCTIPSIWTAGPLCYPVEYTFIRLHFWVTFSFLVFTWMPPPSAIIAAVCFRSCTQMSILMLYLECNSFLQQEQEEDGRPTAAVPTNAGKFNTTRRYFPITWLLYMCLYMSHGKWGVTGHHEQG